jgi:hypothetical protein
MLNVSEILGMVGDTSNPSTQEAEAGVQPVQCQPDERETRERNRDNERKRERETERQREREENSKRITSVDRKDA